MIPMKDGTDETWPKKDRKMKITICMINNIIMHLTQKTVLLIWNSCFSILGLMLPFTFISSERFCTLSHLDLINIVNLVRDFINLFWISSSPSAIFSDLFFEGLIQPKNHSIHKRLWAYQHIPNKYKNVLTSTIIKKYHISKIQHTINKEN